MEWTETERGGKKLLLDGYIYVKKKNLTNGWESYECELRRNRHECKARIKVKESGDNEFRERTEHNHPPNHGKANAYKVRAAMKRMAVATEASPQQILIATMHQATEEGLMAMPGLENIRRSIRRQRQDSREALAMDRMVKDLEALEGQRSVSAGNAPMSHPGLNNIQRCIWRQQQDSREGFAMDRMAERLEVLEGQSSVAAEEEPMSRPGLNNTQSYIRRQQQDNPEALGIDKMVHSMESLEGQRSVDTEEGLMAQPGISNIWRSIRRQHRDIREALAIRRNVEDQEGLEGQRSSLLAAEGLLTLPGLRNIRGQHQETLEVISICQSNEYQEVPEGYRSSVAAENVSMLVPGWRNIRRQHEDIREAFAIPWDEEDLNAPEGQISSLAREQFMYSHNSGRADPGNFSLVDRYLIFATQRNIQVLPRGNDWFINGTFMAFPTFFQPRNDPDNQQLV